MCTQKKSTRKSQKHCFYSKCPCCASFFANVNEIVRTHLILQVKSKRLLQEQCFGLGPREEQKAESDRWQISRL